MELKVDFMKRLNLEFIRSQFSNEDYILLTEEYKNNKQKLKYICPNNHIGLIRWNEWQQGHRCNICGVTKRSDKKKLTVNFIKEEFRKEGYKLLTRRYENQYQKLEFVCPSGHKYYITWKGWKQGSRCKYCKMNEIRLRFDFVKQAFEKEGYKLLTKEYKNRFQKLEYVCPKGHKHSISWSAW